MFNITPINRDSPHPKSTGLKSKLISSFHLNHAYMSHIVAQQMQLEFFFNHFTQSNGQYANLPSFYVKGSYKLCYDSNTIKEKFNRLINHTTQYRTPD